MFKTKLCTILGDNPKIKIYTTLCNTLLDSMHYLIPDYALYHQLICIQKHNHVNTVSYTVRLGSHLPFNTHYAKKNKKKKHTMHYTTSAIP